MRILLCLWLLIPMILPAQDEDTMVLNSPYATPDKAQGRTMLPLESQLRTAWFTALSNIKMGQLSSAKGDIQKMLQGGQSLGIQRFTPFALSLLVQGEEALKARDMLKAQWFAEMAAILDPQLPEAQAFAAQLAWDQKNILNLVMSMGRYAYCVLQATPYNVVLQTNVLMFLSIEVLVLFLFFTLYLLYCSLPKLLHDTRELFPQKYGGLGVLTLSLGGLLLPVVLGLNWFWIAVWVMMITWGYASYLQRTIAALLMILVAAVAPVLYTWQGRLIALYSPIVKATEALQSHQVTYPYIGDLEMLRGILGNDPDLVFLIGTIYQTNDDDTNAMEAYRLALDSGNAQAYAHLNLGNLYYAQNNYAAAIPEYQKAQSLAPDFIPAYFNLQRAYNANYEYQKGQDIIRQANAVNARAMSRYLSTAKDVVIAKYTVREAQTLADRITRSGILRGKGIRGHGVEHAPLEGWSNPLTLAAIIGVIGSAALHVRRRKGGGYARVCTKCGRTFCSKCKSASESQIYCTQCIHIYIKKDGVPLETKVKKSKEVKSYLSRGFYLRKLMNALFPGFSLLQHDKTFKGFSVYVLFSALVLLGLRLPLLPLLQIHAPLLGGLPMIALALAAVVWLIANAKVLLEKGGM